jgi:hypothetical protein
MKNHLLPFENVKNAVCNSVGDADVKVWLIVSAEGKIGISTFGGGASTQTGIEVDFHCKNNNH